MRIPRTRGAVSGVLLIVAGLWGGLIPFLGPYFDWVIGGDNAWDWTEARFLLSVLPAAAVVLGGFVLLRSANRASAGLGAWLAIAGGAWFTVGNPVSELWNDGVRQAGVAMGGSGQRVFEELTYFYGLGALIVAIAAFALGRLAVRSVRDVELAREAEIQAEEDRLAEARGHAEQDRLTDEARAGGRTPVVTPAGEPVATRTDDRVVVDRDPARNPDIGPTTTEPATSTSTAADRVQAAAATEEPHKRRFLRR